MTAVSFVGFPSSAARALRRRWSASVRPAKPRKPAFRKLRRLTPSQERYAGPNRSSMIHLSPQEVYVSRPRHANAEHRPVSMIEQKLPAVQQRPQQVLQDPLLLAALEQLGDHLFLLGRRIPG